MTTLQDKIAFSKLITCSDGSPFSLEGRPWIVDEFWRPADGWKLWPRAKSKPCETCAALATTVIEHPSDNPTSGCECGGLEAYPIIITMLNLERQDGKTTAAMAYALATLFTSRNKRFGFLCASEDQAETLLRENYILAIKASKKLCDRAICYRLRIEVPSTKSVIEAISCAPTRATGVARTHILVDEARDVPAIVFARYIQAIKAQCGYECPRGHVRIQSDEADKAPRDCSVCGLRLTPWFPRIIATSSSGILTDNPERDWFDATIAAREREPVPGCHVFRSEKPLNPKKHASVSGAIDTAFGDIAGLSDYVESEGRNVAMHKGDDAVSREGLKRCVDAEVGHHKASGAECVAFLDTSLSVEKTSLVILAREDLRKDEKPWHRVYVSHLKWWTPADTGGVIDDNAIYNYCAALLPMFTGLRVLAVDVTFQPWARRFVSRAKAAKVAWGRKIQSWDNHKHQSRAGRADLQQRISDGRIRLPRCDEMDAEFKGVKAAPSGSLEVWVDRNRKRKHADIVESIACCCYLAAMEELSGPRATLRVPKGEERTATQKVLRAMDRVTVAGIRFGVDDY